MGACEGVDPFSLLKAGNSEKTENIGQTTRHDLCPQSGSSRRRISASILTLFTATATRAREPCRYTPF